MKIQNLKAAIKELSSRKLAVLRDWFYEFDNKVWDKQFEQDVKAGKLRKLAESANDKHLSSKN